MKVNDELLSGFLDGELPETQMQAIRELLVDDDKLVERLAEMAQVDHWVAQHAAQIDQKPVPEGINVLLRTEKPEQPEQQNNVVQMSMWRNVNVMVKRHAALAAGIAIFFGIGVNTWDQDDLPKINNEVPSQIASILDKHTSGQTIAAADGSEVKPYFSFANKQGQYCRHFQLKQSDSASTNVACRDASGWSVVASVDIVNGNVQGQYQAASGENQLAEIIDNMSKGPVFDLTQEQAAISKTWQIKTK